MAFLDVDEDVAGVLVDEGFSTLEVVLPMRRSCKRSCSLIDFGFFEHNYSVSFNALQEIKKCRNFVQF
jgi:hypothetical protein